LDALEIQVRKMMSLTVRRSNESRPMLAAVWDEVNALLAAVLQSGGRHFSRYATEEALSALENDNNTMEGAP
jgi:hypothetical protein